MNTPRIKTGHAPEQTTPPHITSDHDWVRQHESELRERYIGNQHLCLRPTSLND